MCLYIDAKATASPPIERIDIYKVVKVWENRLLAPQYSPFQYKSGVNEAAGNVKIRRINKSLEGIDEGIIHCFVNKDMAHRYAMTFNVFTKVICGYGEPIDFVAYGISDEVGFKKIYISSEEIKRCLQSCS